MFFLALYFFSKTINYKLGKIKLTSSQKIFVFLNENLAGIKEVILYSGGKFIVDTFLKLFKENLRVSAKLVLTAKLYFSGFRPFRGNST